MNPYDARDRMIARMLHLTESEGRGRVRMDFEGEWDEEAHPRAKNGQFTRKGQGETGDIPEDIATVRSYSKATSKSKKLIKGSKIASKDTNNKKFSSNAKMLSSDILKSKEEEYGTRKEALTKLVKKNLVTNAELWDEENANFGKTPASVFSSAVAEAKKARREEWKKHHKEGEVHDTVWRVSDVSEEELQEYHPGAQLHRTLGGSTVGVDAKGDIFAVCKHPNDILRGQDLIALAIIHGGDRLDSFTGNHEFYLKCGFEPVSWCEFSNDPKDWPPDYNPLKDKKEPIIFYKYTGEFNKKRPTIEEFKKRHKACSSYQEAMDVRDAEIDKRRGK